MQHLLFPLLLCILVGCNTQDDPSMPATTVSYQIATIADLNNMRHDLDGDYVLTADLDFTGSSFTSDTGWPPIGYPDPFTGTLNGKGHTISNLFINRTSSGEQTGLFAKLENARVDSLGFLNCSVHGSSYTGTLVGRSQSSIIHDCFTEGTIHGGGMTGGLIGLAAFSQIERCYARCTVEGASSVGGLVGAFASSSSATNCYSIGTVSGLDQIGGFAGRINLSAVVNQCYATGRVIDNGTISTSGGFTGSLYLNSRIINCYFKGSVSGTRWVGGLTGSLYDSSFVVTSYCTGSISESWSNSKGIIGNEIDSSILSSFWNITTAAGLKLKAGLYGKTTEQLRSITTYTDRSQPGLDTAWNFETIWAIDSGVNEGYPYLRTTPIDN